MNVPNPCRKSKLEESVIFKKTPSFASRAMKEKHLSSFIFANKAFDIDIPSSHHEMSVLDLKKSKGYYWASAAYFLLGNKAHGFPMWKQLQEQINSEDDKILCFKHLSQTTKNKIFMGLDRVKPTYLDESFKTFSLGFWVLIQLPFQPALLHQWLVMVLRKLNWFENVYMVPLCTYPIPPDVYRQVLKVNDLFLMTHRYVAILFDFLQEQIKSDIEISVDNASNITFLVSEVVDFLTFSQSDKNLEALEILAEHIQANWNPLNDDQSKILRNTNLPLRKRCYLHNPDFWMMPGCKLRLFGNSVETVEIRSIIKDRSVFLPISMSNFRERFWNLFVKKEFEQMSFEIIEQNLGPFCRVIRRLNFYSTRERSLYSIRRLDRGQLTTTLYSAAKVQRSYSVEATKKYLCNVFKKSPFEMMGLDKCDDNSSQSDMPDNPDRFSSLNVEEPSWCIQYSLSSLLADVGVPDQACPDAKENLQDIALRLEARIKKIVINAIISHYKMTDFANEKDEILRDWHVVQYLLPCFVVSYLDLCESSTPATVDQKEWYLRFIHELISTYEIDGIRRSSEKNILEDVSKSSSLQDSIKENGSDKLLNKFEKITAAFFAKLKGDHDAMVHLKKHCNLFRVLYEDQFYRNKLNPFTDLAKKPCLYWNWLMWDFFNRMKLALKRSTVRPTCLQIRL